MQILKFIPCFQANPPQKKAKKVPDDVKDENEAKAETATPVESLKSDLNALDSESSGTESDDEDSGDEDEYEDENDDDDIDDDVIRSINGHIDMNAIVGDKNEADPADMATDIINHLTRQYGKILADGSTDADDVIDGEVINVSDSDDGIDDVIETLGASQISDGNKSNLRFRKTAQT